MDLGQAAAAIPKGGRTVSRVAWSLCALTVALVACALTLAFLNRYDDYLTFLIGVTAAALVGGLVASRRPQNPVGWIIAGYALCFALGEFTRQYATYGFLTEPGALPFAQAMAWVPYWIWFPGVMLLVSFLPLYFPNGRLVSRRWRLVAWIAVLVAVMVTGFAAFQPNDLETPGIPNPLGIESLRPLVGAFDIFIPALWLGVGFASAASLVVRFRSSRGEERQQIKWVAYAVVLLISYLLMDLLFPQALAPAASHVLGDVLLVAPWVAIAAAILRYRLYDIDLVINRTLVYGALTACVVGIYVLVVGYLGQLFRTNSNLLISLIATGVVAVLFAPLRDRLQRTVNHLMYGERDDPYGVLSRLGERLKATDAPDAVLPAIVETVAEALKLPHAAIALKRDDGEFETVSARGHPKGEPLILPLSYGTETIGQLILSPRAPGEPFGPADKRLLDDLARHAEAAAYAVRLTNDLQHSRERLVNAREEERRRLRRDLHDGLGPQLATLTLKLDAARNLLAHEPQAADALLMKLKAQTQAAISDIRRLVYGLRPPTLDELGLVPAIREQATNYSQNGLNVSVVAPEGLPPLPAAVEVAAYRIVQEALTNVSRHARASECCVRLSTGGELELEITDDGIGLPEDSRAGVGLSSMRERAAELGGTCTVEPLITGGTRMLAHLPLAASGEKP